MVKLRCRASKNKGKSRLKSKERKSQTLIGLRFSGFGIGGIVI
jgi:hypothetical protein